MVTTASKLSAPMTELKSGREAHHRDCTMYTQLQEITATGTVLT